MRSYLMLLALLIAASAWSGDEFQFPILREGSGYESSDPSYRLVGIEEREEGLRLWVVADPQVVLTQRGVNRIIKHIDGKLQASRGTASLDAIYFYSSVRDQPRFPAFRITDTIATYEARDGKTYFSQGEKTYGGWAYGPPLRRQQ